MDATRLARYLDLLDHAHERLDWFREWQEQARAGDPKSRLASYKALQEAAEALMDAVAMMVKDDGHVPKDDYENLAIAEAHGLLTSEGTATLREFNGLRNRLVHEYTGITDTVAFDSAERLLPQAERTLQEVKDWLTSKR